LHIWTEIERIVLVVVNDGRLVVLLDFTTVYTTYVAVVDISTETENLCWFVFKKLHRILMKF